MASHYIVRITGRNPNAIDRMIGPYKTALTAKTQGVAATDYSFTHDGDWVFKVYKLNFDNNTMEWICSG